MSAITPTFLSVSNAPPPIKNATFIAPIATPNNVITPPIAPATISPFLINFTCDKFAHNAVNNPTIITNEPAASNVLPIPPPSINATFIPIIAKLNAPITKAIPNAVFLPGSINFSILLNPIMNNPINAVNTINVVPNSIIGATPYSWINAAPISIQAVETISNKLSCIIVL